MATVHRKHPLARTAAAALALLAAGAGAQEEVQRISITGSSSSNSASIAGFGDVPLVRSPFSATVLSASQFKDAGISNLGEITRLDASTTDAYNAPGYWSQLAVRGFTLDNRFNYRRDGLPINAETVIAQQNKQSLEILKGTSGVQAGTSAPGGLVNLVVKRPRGEVRDFTLSWEQDGTVTAAADVGSRSGGFGWRVNAAYTRMNPVTYDTTGHRQMLAGAAEWELGGGTLLEAEFELSEQSQPSVPGFSLLGNRLPSPGSIDPRINLNDQPWSLPVVMQGQTGSVRLTRELAPDWSAQAVLMRQRLNSDDRIAFPFGCSAEGNYDRYCSDGSFDMYDYRSNDEQRTSDALDLSFAGKGMAGGMTHRVGGGVLLTRYTGRFQPLAYNLVGSGTIDGATALPSDPTLNYTNTNRDEHSVEGRLQDAITLDDDWSLWLGVRHTRLNRQSVQTDGSQPTNYDQSFTTPWVALSRNFGAQAQAYLSWGRGVESDVAPNLPQYTNAGQALAAQKSVQIEAGYKRRTDAWDAAVAAFDIYRPLWNDVGTCDGSALTCTRQLDGGTRNVGIDGELEWHGGPWSLRGSAMVLRSQREGSADPSLNGLRPTNVPANSLKAQAAYNVGAVPGLALLGYLTHEGGRMVLPDNSIATGGWSRFDLGARYTQRVGATTQIWRAGIDNVADIRAWKEAPYQFDHAYLYPMPPRTIHASVQLSY